MRFLVRHNRHHKVSQSVPLFKSRKTVTIFLRIKVGGHFVMSIVKCHESHYVGVLDNPHLIAINAYSKWIEVCPTSSTSRLRFVCRRTPPVFGCNILQLLSLIKLHTKMQHCICLLEYRTTEFSSVKDKCGALSEIILAALFSRIWMEDIETLLFLSHQITLAYSSIGMIILVTYSSLVKIGSRCLSLFRTPNLLATLLCI